MGSGLHTLLIALILVIDTVNIIAQGYFLIMLSDLEMDYINPIDLCNSLNRYILPEAILQACAPLLALLGYEWIMFLLLAPIAVSNILAIINNQYLLDATEIFKTLSKQKRTGFMKLIWHVILCFYLIVKLVLAIIEWGD